MRRGLTYVSHESQKIKGIHLDDTPVYSSEETLKRKAALTEDAKKAARKQRRREYYAKNAERIREQSRLKMSEKRRAAFVVLRYTNVEDVHRATQKAKRRKADTLRVSNLSNAELAASQVLTRMLEHKTALATRQTEGVSAEGDRKTAEPASSSGEIEEEMAVDREIACLVDQAAFSSESSSDEDEGMGADGPLSEPTTEVEDRSSFGVIPADGGRKKRLHRLRLPIPMANSPSPSPEGPMPSFYDTLWLALEKNRQ
ncbi:hypothetical protein C8R45DRAFT_948406 [Mycena sanguinolenta]|nr:hypothetical protein C8R45DRAFT_948406 [Mycena sanguinolenta]